MLSLMRYASGNLPGMDRAWPERRAGYDPSLPSPAYHGGPTKTVVAASRHPATPDKVLAELFSPFYESLTPHGQTQVVIIPSVAPNSYSIAQWASNQ